jgi:hypothetical protein
MAHTVFFSWQSDLKPRRSYSGFIKEALEIAIGELNEDVAIEDAQRPDEASGDEPQLKYDEATAGVSGFPEIATTLFKKIDECRVFVADISIINRKCACDVRPTPNPNVLYELGYAMARRGWENVIPVINTVTLRTGKVEELPFDLRRCRPLRYKFEDGDKRAEALKQLKTSLKDAIELVLRGGVRNKLKLFLQQTNPDILQAISSGRTEIRVAIADSRMGRLQELMRLPNFDRFAEIKSDCSRMDNHTCMQNAYIHDKAFGARGGFVLRILPAFSETELSTR